VGGAVRAVATGLRYASVSSARRPRVRFEMRRETMQLPTATVTKTTGIMIAAVTKDFGGPDIMNNAKLVGKDGKRPGAP
jgi:hypothetical protein